MPHTLPPSAPELRASRLALGQDRLQLADAVLRVREEVRLHLGTELQLWSAMFTLYFVIKGDLHSIYCHIMAIFTLYIVI